MTLVGLNGDRQDSNENMETNASPANQTTGARVVLSLRGISKRYGPVKANDVISIDFRAGEIHAVLGENGSGKSTVMGIASGAVQPDEGVVEIDGQPPDRRIAEAEATRLGLGMAYQTMTEVAGLTVAENLFLATPDRAPPDLRPDGGMGREQACSEYQLDIRRRRRRHRDLSLAQRQMLEVVQALLSNPKVLLLDEPTTALGHTDVERLHDLIRTSPATGVGVVYVSHRLPEVLERRPPCDGAARRREPGHVRCVGMSEPTS